MKAPPTAPSAFSRLRIWLAGAFISLAILLAYSNSFSVPFVYDDPLSISENRTIRHLWPPWEALSPPSTGGLTVSGRPLLNFSLAVNYAISGTAVRSYHALNLLIHILAALLLFGIVRRTVEKNSRFPFPSFKRNKAARGPGSQILEPKSNSIWLAAAVTLVWALHPLQTESVTYVVQRAESLAGLFYFLTLYSFIRGVESTRKHSWFALSCFACLCGMATKEVVVSAPLMALLYDRTFVAGTFRRAWSERRGFYAGLFSTWLLLGYLVLSVGGRGGTAGFNSGVPWWQYALKQSEAITHYLWLTLWPRALVFDYGTDVTQFSAAIVPFLLFIGLLVFGTLFALRQWPVLGFAGAWFFCALAPSSSIVPVATETMAEHRMYLALAAVVSLVVLGIFRLLGARSLPVFFAAAIALGITTFQRNKIYRDEMVLWQDTIAKCPGNVRPYNNVGLIYLRQKQPDEAIRWFQRALEIRPDYALALNNFGNALLQKGDVNGALVLYQKAIAAKPDYAEAYYNAGNLFLRKGQPETALICYERALAVQPDYLPARNNLGSALLQLGRTEEAIRQFQIFLEAEPDYVVTRYNLANAFLQQGRIEEAIAEYKKFLRTQPDHPEARYNLGSALLQTRQWDEAVDQFQKFLQFQPQDAGARHHLAYALFRKGSLEEAIAQYEVLLRSEPELGIARFELAEVLARAGRCREAVPHLEIFLKANENSVEARVALARCRLQEGQRDEARTMVEAALRLKPDDAEALELARRLRTGGP